jgi:iron complex outermembrane recepter protein
MMISIPNERSTRALLGSCCTIALIVSFAGDANAQTVPAQAKASPDTLAGDIVVTAERRSGTLQKTPLSITALTGNDLAKARISSVADLRGNVPGLQVSTLAGYTYPYIRGIGSNALGLATDSSVAVMFDGVYLSRPEVANVPFGDIERVEVLRGPQGTLYGRNATGGLINVVEKQPSETFDAAGTLEYGSYNHVLGQAYLTGPVSDLGHTAVSFSYVHLSDDGYIRNLGATQSPGGAPDRYDDQGTDAARFQIKSEVTDRLTVRLAADYTRIREAGNQLKPINAANAGFAEAFPQVFGKVDVPGNFYEGDITIPLKNNGDFYGIHGYVDYQLADDIKLSSITAFRRNKSDVCYSSGGTNIDMVDVCFVLDSQQISQELQLTGKTGRFSWVVGLYYFNENGANDFYQYYPTAYPSAFGLPSPSTTFKLGSTELWWLTHENTDAYAAYAQGTYALSDKLHFTGGIRYSIETKSFGNAFSEAGVGAPGGAYGPVTFQGSRTWHQPTPKFGIEYFPTSHLMLYASATKGFKSGGFNSTSVGIQQPYNPETVWSYEGGLKSQWLDNKVRLNMSGFYYNYDNLQVNSYSSGHSVVTNAASAELYGGEAELRVNPIPSFTISGSLALLHAEYRNYTSPGQFVAAQTVNLSGNTLPKAPKVSVNAAVEKYFDLAADYRLTFRGDYSYTGRQYYSAYDGNLSQNGYSLVNAQISLAPQQGKWTLGFYVKNLTGTKYYLDMEEYSTVGEGIEALAAPPRTFGGSISYRWK